jgi:hypothetical protein
MTRILAAWALAGTGLIWAAVPRPDPRAALAFVLAGGAAALAVRGRAAPWRPAAFAVLLAAALAVAVGPELGTPRLGEALFSSRHGLLFWNPVAWLGLAGLALLGRRDPRLAATLAAGLVLAIVVLACGRGEAGGPFAARRFAPVLALLAPALATALAALVGLARRAPGRLLAGAAALLVAWNMLLMEQYRRGSLPRDAPVSFVAVAENNAALLSALAGSPVAWPANWIFAWRHGLPAARYDLLAGKRLAAAADGRGRAIEVGDLSQDAALLLEGWSVRHPCAGGTCRDVEGAARLVAPLEAPGPFDLAVLVSGEGVLAAAVNGDPLGARTLPASPALLRFPYPRAWGALNVIALSVAPGGRARVDRLLLEPRPGAS